MICDVKCVIRDFPKRTDMSRDIITVEAETDDEAMAQAIDLGRIKWPGGKIKPYDVTNKRQAMQKRSLLKAKTA